ncbi:MAG TPA: hypothetical protein EYO33_21055 [Phycisphaerales bacterium]|nr:hypothetical protein [Phycisphaerales bacterium]
MSSCPERAQKIVDLLLNDTGVGAVFFRPKRSKGIPGKKIHVCSGCKEEFEPEYRSRQFCSRQCYMDYLARKRKRRKPTNPVNFHPKALGPGKRVPDECVSFILSKSYLTVPQLQDEVMKRFDLHLSSSTLYRTLKDGKDKSK